MVWRLVSPAPSFSLRGPVGPWTFVLLNKFDVTDNQFRHILWVFYSVRTADALLVQDHIIGQTVGEQERGFFQVG